MQKSAPSPARIGVMVAFALSCFGLLLFLWLSFGGPVPLKPKGYRFQVAFPESATLGLEADVRVAGVSVGKVRRKELDPDGNRTLTTIEVDRRFAPVHSDAHAILRQKTLLGETYVELTPGTKNSAEVPEGGRLTNAQVANSVELDEIFQAFDPQTRDAFRTWQRDGGAGIKDRGRDFNDALGTLPGFAADGSDLLAILDSQEGALQRLVKNTGVVFGAITENEAQLRALIVSSARVFRATASKNDALAESIHIFPTFLDESKSVMARLKDFSLDAEPLARDLQPVARDLQPTLRDVRAFAPDLQRTFKSLDPLINASKTGLPALRDTLDALGPTLGALGPFLSQVNPILEYLEASQYQLSDFLANGAGALADTTLSPSGGVGHYLRQFGPTGSESAGVFRSRLATNRGNAYFEPMDLFPTEFGAKHLMFPNWDCKPSGGEKIPDTTATRPDQDTAPGCWVQPKFTFKNRLQGQFPHIEAADYASAAKK
jgi:virulence factor Mce-like protein